MIPAVMNAIFAIGVSLAEMTVDEHCFISKYLRRTFRQLPFLYLKNPFDKNDVFILALVREILYHREASALLDRREASIKLILVREQKQ